MTIIRKAWDFAKVAHAGQRYGDKPFIYHPAQVSKIIRLICPEDENLIAAGFLHDILEDTKVQYSDLVAEFNTDVASLVWEVTKTAYNTFPNLKTLRGVILKYADRLSNLCNIRDWDIKKQEKYLLKSKFWQV